MTGGGKKGKKRRIVRSHFNCIFGGALAERALATEFLWCGEVLVHAKKSNIIIIIIIYNRLGKRTSLNVVYLFIVVLACQYHFPLTTYSGIGDFIWFTSETYSISSRPSTYLYRRHLLAGHPTSSEESSALENRS